MNRQEKIKLLSGIATKKTSLDVLKPCRFKIRVGYGTDGNLWLVNGQPVTKDDFNARMQARIAMQSGLLGFTVNYIKP